MGKNNDNSKKQGMTRRRQLIGIIHELSHRNGYAPRVIDITNELGEISHQAVWKHIDRLHQQGLIRYEYGKDGKVFLR